MEELFSPVWNFGQLSNKPEEKENLQIHKFPVQAFLMKKFGCQKHSFSAYFVISTIIHLNIE